MGSGKNPVLAFNYLVVSNNNDGFITKPSPTGPGNTLRVISQTFHFFFLPDISALFENFSFILPGNFFGSRYLD